MAKAAKSYRLLLELHRLEQQVEELRQELRQEELLRLEAEARERGHQRDREALVQLLTRLLIDETLPRRNEL